MDVELESLERAVAPIVDNANVFVALAVRSGTYPEVLAEGRKGVTAAAMLAVAEARAETLRERGCERKSKRGTCIDKGDPALCFVCQRLPAADALVERVRAPQCAMYYGLTASNAGATGDVCKHRHHVLSDRITRVCDSKAHDFSMQRHPTLCGRKAVEEMAEEPPESRLCKKCSYSWNKAAER